MSYTENIPVSGDTLGSTRDRIRGNFQEITVVEAINHVAFNAVGKGKHKFLQMPVQASAPTTLANEAGFYSKIGGTPAESNLFFRGESDGFEYQLTNADQTNNATFSTYTVYDGARPYQTGGWTFLPGGLLLFYGFSKFSSGQTRTVTFPRAFSTIYSANFNLQTPTTDVFMFLGTLTNNDFQVRATKNISNVFYWTAIGKA